MTAQRSRLESVRFSDVELEPAEETKRRFDVYHAENPHVESALADIALMHFVVDRTGWGRCQEWWEMSIGNAVSWSAWDSYDHRFGIHYAELWCAGLNRDDKAYLGIQAGGSGALVHRVEEMFLDFARDVRRQRKGASE